MRYGVDDFVGRDNLFPLWKRGQGDLTKVHAEIIQNRSLIDALPSLYKGRGWLIICKGKQGRIDMPIKNPKNVIPAKGACPGMIEAEGSHKCLKTLDSPIKSGNDRKS